MDFADRAVERDRLELDSQELFPLQVLEDPVEDAALRPAIHASVDGVPLPKPPRPPAPLAAVLGDIQDGIQHPQIRETDIASLHGEVGRNACVLRFGEFHPGMIT